MTGVTLSPTQDQTLAALRAVLAQCASTPAAQIVLGQANRVPPPAGTDYIVMTPLRRTRLETNSDNFDDCRIIGGISGTTLTVASVTFGTVTVGRLLWIPPATALTIVSQLSGTPGGPGTYQVSASASVASNTVMGCGATAVLAPYQLDVQVDVHGSGGSSQAADNAQIISGLFRDDWSFEAFKSQIASVVPLHADDPIFMPGFVDGEDQYEDRWVVEVRLQVNATISVAQRYADSAVVGIINVDAVYPP